MINKEEKSETIKIVSFWIWNSLWVWKKFQITDNTFPWKIFIFPWHQNSSWKAATGKKTLKIFHDLTGLCFIHAPLQLSILSFSVWVPKNIRHKKIHSKFCNFTPSSKRAEESSLPHQMPSIEKRIFIILWKLECFSIDRFELHDNLFPREKFITDPIHENVEEWRQVNCTTFSSCIFTDINLNWSHRSNFTNFP